MKLTSASVVGLALVMCVAAKSHGRDDGMAAVMLSRETRANFVVVSVVRIDFEGMEPATFDGAEFHSGPYHRLEDANFRGVADCHSSEAFVLTIASGEIRTGPEAAAALCGVGPFPPSADVTFLGTITTEFGDASRVEVNKPEFIQTYDILENGAIVRNVMRSKASDGRIVYESVAKAYCKSALPVSAFSKASLSTRLLPSACGARSSD